MNLWAKSLRQLAFFAVALFFFSCEDDTISGYKTNPKFKVSYVEIPLNSSVVLMDAVSTTNYQPLTITNRQLLGQYEDPIFGKVKSDFYTAFFPKDFSLDPSAEYDSVSVELAYDFYYYGSETTFPQSMEIYQLAEPFDTLNYDKYNNSSSLPVDDLLASKSFAIDPAAFKDIIEKRKDTTISIKIPLPTWFGSQIFAEAESYRDTRNLPSGQRDTTWIYPKLFATAFPGLAFKTTAGDKVVGFNPGNARTRILLHYHTPTIDSLQIRLGFDVPYSFNQIISDRSSGQLSSVTEPFVDYTPIETQRHIQAGAGIFTKIDLSPFLAFADTIPNAIISEAVIELREVGEDLPSPASLAMMVLNDDNRPHKYDSTNSQDGSDFLYYGGNMRPEVNSFFQPIPNTAWHVYQDGGSKATFQYDSDDHNYKALITNFIQEFFYRDGRSHPKNFGLYSYSPENGKAVTRTVFSNNIVLKIYYTTPSESNQ